jgi:hypothetical protein
VATKISANVQNLTQHLKNLGLSDKETKDGYFVAPKSGTGKEFIIFLPEKNRFSVAYTKKTRKDFLTNELLPNLMKFNGAKYQMVPKNSTAGQISFAGSQIYIIAKLIAMKGAGASKGAAFEYDLEKDFKSSIAGTNVFVYPDFMKEFEQTVLKGAKVIDVDVTGKENTPRPLKFDAQGIYCSLRGGRRTTDIGSGLADVKVKVRTQAGVMKVIDLSAKYGKTVTFFNSGLGTGTFPPSGAFPPEFFQMGTLQDGGPGDRILKLFGLDPQRFREVFTSYKEKDSGVIQPKKAPKAIEEVVLNGPQKKELQEFLKTIIGQNYYLLHLDDKKKVHIFEMTQQFLEKAAMPITNLTIEYPVGGSAKRINIKLETVMYKLTFNIRSKAAGVTYPTHIMCDYEFKH